MILIGLGRRLRKVGTKPRCIITRQLFIQALYLAKIAQSPKTIAAFLGPNLATLIVRYQTLARRYQWHWEIESYFSTFKMPGDKRWESQRLYLMSLASAARCFGSSSALLVHVQGGTVVPGLPLFE
jgi:hypothetical protein